MLRQNVMIVSTLDPGADSPLFKRSSYCQELSCVAVAADADGDILVRDTKMTADGPVLRFSTQEWVDFLSGVAAGEFTPTALSGPLP